MQILIILLALNFLHQWGYKTKISKTLKTNEGYLAGSDKLRASELNKFFADDEVDAILCFGGAMVVHVFLIY